MVRASARGGRLPRNNASVRIVNLGLPLPVSHMKMRRLVIVPVHRHHQSIESANLRHGVGRCSFASIKLSR